MDPIDDPSTSKSNTSEWSSKIKSDGMKRTITGLFLVAYLGISIHVGLPFILLNALIIQMKCFSEIINVGYNIKKMSGAPYSKPLNWYLIVVVNYFFAGEVFFEYLDSYKNKYNILWFLMCYHRLITFCCYLIGLIFFVSTMSRKIIREQFTLLAWTHFLLIIISAQSFMIVANVFQGLIWLILPFSLVIINDSFAYIFGKALGKTPLTYLSPKKTAEGFIYGGVSTVAFAVLLSRIIASQDYMVCPTVLKEFGERRCTREQLFQMSQYRFGIINVSTYPFTFHAIVIALFASFVAPFGGFFASGFKRAVKIKDFGHMIPGHGGFVDRFDCQFLMATFVNVYVSTFVKSQNVDELFRKISDLKEADQLGICQDLKSHLIKTGVLE